LRTWHFVATDAPPRVYPHRETGVTISLFPWQEGSMRILMAISLLVLALAAPASAEEEVFLASGPDLSPDGSTLVFSWHGDLWSVPVAGGVATALTHHPAEDQAPFFSPDGREIAFVSSRGTGEQVFVMPSAGGAPEPITFDTEGGTLLGWFPDGEGLLVRKYTDRAWRNHWRFFRIERRKRAAPEMLFDAAGRSAEISPDGRSVLFSRDGMAWWWKGYRGPRASQVWRYDFETSAFTKLIHRDAGARYPCWLGGAKTFVFTDMADREGNLHRFDPATGQSLGLTRFETDTVVAPTASADGKLIVFRHRFDLYRLRPGEDAAPVKIRIVVTGDRETRARDRRRRKTATGAAFSRDGLEIVFTAGGDLFVMDTVLKEPKQITKTPEDETQAVFTPDADMVFFVATRDGQGDICRAERNDPAKYWWRNDGFVVTNMTNDPANETSLLLSPDGKRIAFVRGRGDLVVMNVDGSDERVIVSSFDAPEPAWSPDGHWIAFAVMDADFNRDIWIAKADGSGEPVNVSRHPDSDWEPTWSPDGKVLAFLSRRRETETDVHYVWLREEDEEQTKRDRTLEEALEKMKKGRKPEKPKKAPEKKKEADDKPPPKEDEKKKKPLVIDFDRIHDRVRAISIKKVRESGLFWSPDGKKLAFSATIDGKKGVYTITFPEDLKPKLMTTTSGSKPVWVKEGNAIRWLVRGVPTVTVGSKTTGFPFDVRQEVDVAGRYGAAFDVAWRILRDHFYDGRMNNRNWDDIRRKYRGAATRSPDRNIFGKVVSLMLGELNASHLGFSVLPERREGYRDEWTNATGHLGLRWDPEHKGPGLKVLDVVPDGPADRAASRIRAGEVVLSIDGTTVDPAMDLAAVLTGRPDRDVSLRVAKAEGKERTVVLRPTSLSVVRRLLYAKWVRDNETRVHELSKGKLGYLHVRGMSWSSFYEFERQLFAAGYGRDGLVIDVRSNGGGFTADHLLTALTQPDHAYTISRGGAPGYPQDRKVYATWRKPIVVLIDQRSFSNAEIFAHAIRSLGRGRLVGVQTAGGVISTGGARVMDLGFIRTPGRGWFLRGDGQDLEQNGARPDVEVWPEPGDAGKGIDRQLEKGVEVLLEEVAAWRKAGLAPKPTYRSERDG